MEWCGEMIPSGNLYRGFSLHIGLNEVDPASYGGWEGRLAGCHADAYAMALIPKWGSYEWTELLLDEQAERSHVRETIEEVSGIVEPGDTFLLTYSGHGGQLPDPESDEADHLDETWCLWDGELLDDELWTLFAKFPKWSRIIVVSDSCYAHGMVRSSLYRYRSMPGAVIQTAYEAQQGLYDGIERLGREKYKDGFIKASVCWLPACQENQYAMDGRDGGLFTQALSLVWQDGAFAGDYRRFHREILRHMPADQSPGLEFTGRRDLNFHWSTPFKLR